MKNKIFTYYTKQGGTPIGDRKPKFVREITNNNGIQLLRGDIRLDETHNLRDDETALVIISSNHSLVICSRGGFFDDVKVWSGEDIKALQAAVETLQKTKQDATSENLATTEKEIVYAINEVYRGGLRPNAIELDKLHSSIRETLGKVGISLKVLPSGTDLTSKTLEDGVWIVADPNSYTFPPSWFSGNGLALLIVNKASNNVIMIGHDTSSYELPAWASRNLNSTFWRGASKGLEDIFIKQGAGNVKEADLADGAVTSRKIAEGAVLSVNIADMAVKEAKLGLDLADKINGAAQKAVVSKALEVIELTDNNTQNKTAIDARIAKLTELGVDITNGYAIPISYISGNKEYHGMVTAGKNSLLNGIVSDAQGGSYFSISVGATDGIVTFEEGDPLVFKSEMSSAIDTLVECVEFTKTTLSNKAHLDAYLEKVPNAKVMCCTYNGSYAGTLHKINGSWYGVLVGESNTLAGQLSIKLQADGTIVEGTA